MLAMEIAPASIYNGRLFDQNWLFWHCFSLGQFGFFFRNGIKCVSGGRKVFFLHKSALLAFGFLRYCGLRFVVLTGCGQVTGGGADSAATQNGIHDGF